VEQQQHEHHGKASFLGPEGKEAGKRMFMFSEVFLHIGWLGLSLRSFPHVMKCSMSCGSVK